ncbi:MAG: TerC family protein [Caldilineaceae bacterium]
MEVHIWGWIAFNVVVIIMLLVDLLVLQHDAHEIKTKEAAFWSAFWIVVSLLFCGGIYYFAGSRPALEFLTAYVVEKALSVDNIFVFIVVFLFFGVPAKYQHRVLFWGVLAALVMRGAFITVGFYLVHRFQWLMLLFGLFLIYTGARMFYQDDDEHLDLENSWAMRITRRFLPVTPDYRGANFFVKEEGRWLATPLFMVLIVINVVDLVFAFDSIPAVLAVTSDSFLAYSSNILAILGLRALYFLLASVLDKFRFLKLGLAFILVFVGVKMLIEEYYHISIGASLGIIMLALAVSIAASLLIPVKEAEETQLVESG